MLSEEKVRKIVEANIKQNEDLGDRVGGSGHLGYISYQINEISKPKKITVDKQSGWEITYTYTLFVETEFTYYPDNPPYEYRYEKTIVVDDKGHILKEMPKEGG